MPAKVDYSAQRAQTLGASQDEEAVTVNTRALIDKVLARYSGEWTVLRELLQNAADASASKVTIKFETLPSSTVPLPHTSDSGSLLKHTLLHHTLKRLLVTNDGQPFGPNDWSRLKRIAEGNPDETKIGAFGVGFYSVFADCEEPFVSSGKEAMAFYWKGNSLFTRRSQLPESQANADTAFVLDFRNVTSQIPKLLPLCQFLASSLTFVGLQKIELWLDDWRILDLNKVAAPSHDIQLPRDLEKKTSEGFMKVASVTRQMAQLDAKWLNIVGWIPLVPGNNGSSIGQAANVRGLQSSQSLRTFFSRLTISPPNAVAEKAAKEDQATQEIIAENLVGESTATIFLHVNTAIIMTSVSQAFGQELERATKKPPPKSTHIGVLTSSYDENRASDSSASGAASKAVDIFLSVLPSKSGRIFIGFPTHQTTGLNAHISAPSVIPTVERESIDLNARWVRTWNTELLRAAGIVCRIAWSGEMDNVRDKLSRALDQTGSVKASKQHITDVLPEVIHVFKQFTYRESTPSSQVGNLIEEAFWTCSRSASIDVLSSCGILPSRDVRIATEDLSFVDGIPVLPKPLVEQASDFINKLTEYGIITEITITDIKKELESKALTSSQLLAFISWLGSKASKVQIEPLLVKSLLEVAVANDIEEETKQEKLIHLGGIKHYINASRIPPEAPVPSSTMPFKYTKSLTKSELDALGWEDLQLVPWLRWLVENIGGQRELKAEQDLTQSPSFAAVVLLIVSKQWDGLSQSSKATVTDLMSNQTVIPTKMGMKKPSEAYFPSVKLFDDLPVISGLNSSVKDKVLLALGVRKTVEIGVIFARLMTSDSAMSEGQSGGKWSHVDVIKYLASVRNDIPATDIQRLRMTPMCLAEAGHPDKSSSQRYIVSELFEPNEVLRSLNLRLMQWPGLYRPGSHEGRFLSALGLRAFPAVPELINIMANAGSSGDYRVHDLGLKYFINHHHTNGYASYSMQSNDKAFLPSQFGEASRMFNPSQIFTNEAAAILGYDILRRDLHINASKFGVQSDPPMADCVNRLIKTPPASKRNARDIFKYLASRLGEIRPQDTELLGVSNIVPVSQKDGIARGYTEKKEPMLDYLQPRLCFLGDGDRFGDVLDYVDFGDEANVFLLKCGSKHEPSTVELARLLVREPARVFSVWQSVDRYLDLLRNFADAWPTLSKDKSLVKEMRKAPFLLANKEVRSVSDKGEQRQQQDLGASEEYNEDDNASVRTSQLASAGQVVVVDDMISFNQFKGDLLTAPWEETLENFYLHLGAPLLGSLVESQYRVGNVIKDQSPAFRIQKLVQERCRLFLHDIPRDAIKHDAKWIEKNLSVTSVQWILVRKTLRGRNLSHNDRRGAATVNVPGKGWVLYIAEGNNDLFQVSQALLELLLQRPKAQQAMMLEVLLETDLLKLRARGYNVDRILRQKAAETRIAEDQRRKQLEEEQNQLKGQQKAWKMLQAQKLQEQKAMPGIFPETPEQRQPELVDHGLRDIKKPKGPFSGLSKLFGGGGSSTAVMASNNAAQDPPPYTEEEIPRLPQPNLPGPETATASHHLQENLVNAIQASRAHNSTSVTSRPAVNEVKETHSYCDSSPGQNITFLADTSSGVKIFVSNNVSDKHKFMATNAGALNMFASILLDCAGVFALSRSALHIFYDDTGSTIAFNQNKALFCNYRYFENLHLEVVQRGSKADALIYWFVVLCHEVSHNLVADHSADHSFYTEQLVVRYFADVAAKIAGLGAGSNQVAGLAPSIPPLL